MIPLYILAGGASSRFGSDKARAELEGVSLIDRVASGLSAVVGPATVVAAVPDSYADLGLRTIGDLVPGQGPLGGLVTALGDAGGPVFLAACDLREPRPDWAEVIIAVDDTVAFKGAHGWEPLFARYEVSALGVAQGLLDRGERSMQKLLDEVGTALPAPADWPDEPSFNTPGELG
ncbi:MAG: molybdenum cofactor guanylyltransferase [Acidimicrobiia bacterium]|nr:molybdenum cofactor guanylyltransferase [Acidimicrobiia bacterium]